MATPTIGLKFKVDGEKEFKDAISNINSGLGVLNSEMNKTKAQFQDNADSVEALTAKNDILERKLYTQKDKVEECRKALEYLASQGYGEADEAMMKWQKSLNEAEKDVYNTEAAIRKNNEALEDVGKGTEKATFNIKEFAKACKVEFAAVAAAITAVIEVEKKLINLTKESASSADNILTLSQITGLDTDSIQELQYASELIDVSFETIQGSMAKLVRNMSSAQKGTGDAADAFKALGVSIVDSSGELRNNNDVFNEVIDKLGEIDNETQRDAYAMAIFGKSAQDLNPLIVQGSQVLQDYRDEAHDVAYVLTEEQLDALGAVDDAYQRLTNTQEGIKNQIGAELAPVVEEFYTAWTQFIAEAGKAFVDSGLLDMFKDLLKNFTDFLKQVSSANEDGIPNLEQKFSTLRTALNDVALLFAAIKDSINFICNVSTFQFGKALQDLGFGYNNGNANNYQTTKMKQEGTYSQYYDYYASTSDIVNKYGYGGYDSNTGLYYDKNGNYVYNASGDDNFKGGLTWVGESGAELVNLPQGSQIYSNQESRKMSGDTYNITIDAKSVREFNDIVTIVKNSRVNARMRG